MAISRKIAGFMESSSWIRKMFETGAELKKTYGADKVYDFSLGNPSVPAPEEFETALREAVDEDIPNKHGYMPNAGYPQVRAALAQRVSENQGVAVGAADLIVTCGAGGALNVVIKTLVNDGDEILAMVPYFVEYRFYADNHGATLTLAETRDDFSLDIAKIEAVLTERTAAVVINSPNNPSGAVYSAESLDQLGRLLEKKSAEFGRTIYLISDEPYRSIVYDGVTVPSVFAHYTNSIVVTSFSKELSLAGERIGYAVVHPEVDDHDALVNGMTLCNRIIGFVNAPALMQRAIAKTGEVHVEVEQYRRKRDLLCDGLHQAGYEFEKPQGTFFLMLPAPGGDDVEFARRLQEKRILVVPGRGFGLPGYCRISYAVKDQTIHDSLPGFGEVLASYA